jgi:hypothetical protein
MVILNAFVAEAGKDRVLFVADYHRQRDLSIFKRINKIDYPVHRIASAGLPVEQQLNNPYCFVLTPGYRAECVFLPVVGYDEHFKSYLQLVKNKYFNL